MAGIINDYYLIDEQLQGNPSVENLIRLMQVSYTIKTGEPMDIESLTPQELQKIFVGKVNRVWLGFWPTEGPVEKVYYGSQDPLMKSGMRLVHPYDHDNRGNPMVLFRLTENERKLRNLGLDNFLPGHTISLYLEPRK